MTMVRAYTNADEGVCLCFWEAPSRDELAGLFDTAGVPFETMYEVSEFAPATA